MSKVLQKNSDGETLVIPLEIPMYQGNTNELQLQALTNLVSALRHLAAADALDNSGLIDDEESDEIFYTEFHHATEQLISTIISLVTICESYGIDINRELWETPFTV